LLPEERWELEGNLALHIHSPQEAPHVVGVPGEGLVERPPSLWPSFSVQVEEQFWGPEFQKIRLPPLPVKRQQALSPIDLEEEAGRCKQLKNKCPCIKLSTCLLPFAST
jgi:hypothetical protein